MSVLVRDMALADAAACSLLADALFGPGYYPPAKIIESLQQSTLSGVVCSHVATSARGQLLGFRIALPPGRWASGRGEGLSPDLWPLPLDDCGYFQSAFVAFEVRGQGIGPLMAAAAEDALVRLGARAIVTHSWKESPDNASMRYLSRLGFTTVTEYPGYWSKVDYECFRDGNPCQCTAVEMIKLLDEGAS